MCGLLIIEDDRDLLRVTKSLLTKRGFAVETDINFEDGFQKVKSFQPQIILLDVFLSDVDGFEICKQLKSNPLTSHIPVIIFSAYPSIAGSAIYDYGADDFIAKPFEVNELELKLHLVLSQPAGLA